MFEFLLGSINRVVTQWHHHHNWFCYDKPNRIKNGFGPDGLYPDERSQADKERIGLKKPDEKNKCPR